MNEKEANRELVESTKCDTTEIPKKKNDKDAPKDAITDSNLDIILYDYGLNPCQNLSDHNYAAPAGKSFPKKDFRISSSSASDSSESSRDSSTSSESDQEDNTYIPMVKAAEAADDEKKKINRNSAGNKSLSNNNGVSATKEYSDEESDTDSEAASNSEELVPKSIFEELARNEKQNYSNSKFTKNGDESNSESDSESDSIGDDDESEKVDGSNSKSDRESATSSEKTTSEEGSDAISELARNCVKQVARNISEDASEAEDVSHNEVAKRFDEFLTATKSISADECEAENNSNSDANTIVSDLDADSESNSIENTSNEDDESDSKSDDSEDMQNLEFEQEFASLQNKYIFKTDLIFADQFETSMDVDGKYVSDLKTEKKQFKKSEELEAENVAGELPEDSLQNNSEAVIRKRAWDDIVGDCGPSPKKKNLLNSPNVKGLPEADDVNKIAHRESTDIYLTDNSDSISCSSDSSINDYDSYSLPAGKKSIREHFKRIWSNFQRIRLVKHSDMITDQRLLRIKKPPSEYSSSSLEEDVPDEANKIRYWEEMSGLPIDSGLQPTDTSIHDNASRDSSEMDQQEKTDKSSDSSGHSDDSDEEEHVKTTPAKYFDGRDFYEDDIINAFDDFKIKFSESTTTKETLKEYEETFRAICRLIKLAPNHLKFEISSLMYPMLALSYLLMIVYNDYQRGKHFVEKSQYYFDDSYTVRLDKLKEIQVSEDVTYTARRMLAGYEKLDISMACEAYRVCLLHIEDWPRPQQEKMLIHFKFNIYDGRGEPRQRPRIGAGPLSTLFYAAPEPPHKKAFRRQMLRGRRLRKTEPTPSTNAHLPVSDRVFTPTPKRMELLRRKNDERHLVTLSKENLPSVFLYTTSESDEVVICASFSENSTMLAIGTFASKLHVYALTPSKLVQLKSASWLKVLDTGMAGIDKNMLEPGKKKVRRTLLGHQGPIYNCAFGPGDRFLLSCSEDRTVRCWCLRSWSCVVIYPGHSAPIYCVSFAPFGYYFATGSDDRTARIWTQDSKQPVHVLCGHLAEIGCCVFHPNTHYLATGSADCTVRIWDITRALQVRLLTGHKGNISALAYSICGRFLVSGANDSFIIVWDTMTEKMVRCLSHHTAPINTIEFSLDNNLLMVGGEDCLLSIWDFESILKDYVPQKLSRKQCRRTQDRAKEPPLPPKSLLSSEDFLLRVYASKETPFYRLRTTRRNLLLAFCATQKQTKVDEKKIMPVVNKRADYAKWIQFLHILKLKAWFGLQGINATTFYD